MLRRAPRAPQKGWTLLLLKVVVVGRSCFWQVPSLSQRTHGSFWSLTLWFDQRKPSFAPVQMAELKLAPKATSEVAAARSTWPLPSCSPSAGAWWVAFSGSQARCWRFARVFSTFSPSLRFLCGFNQHFILVRSLPEVAVSVSST